jgi:uncharacterized protein (UPF0305 family)
MRKGTVVCDLWHDAGRITGKRDLAEFILRHVQQYSLNDLQMFRGAIERELRHLPPPYRRKLYPKMKEQVFGTHHRLLLMHRSGDFAKIHGNVGDRFREYCTMVERACTACVHMQDARREALYFLLAAFNMFVLDLPGHPVGTPFPGGFRVEMRFGEFLCPIRDKEGEVETSICPFCPARQSVL